MRAIGTRFRNYTKRLDSFDKHIVWFQWFQFSKFYTFSVLKLFFHDHATNIFFDLLLQFRFRGGRRFCKIYSIKLYRSFRRGRIRIHASYHLHFVCATISYILFEKGNRIALNATKEIAIMFQF